MHMSNLRVNRVLERIKLEKVKFTQEQATKTQMGRDVQLYFTFNLGARWGWVVNATPRPL